jgi:hypothetical protein
MQSTWGRSIPCCCKVAAARGKCGLGKVANMDWHEISECAIKYATIRPGSQISKIAIHLRSNTAPASAATSHPWRPAPVPQGRSFHRTVDRNDPGAPATLPPHFPRAATHQGRRCVSSAPVATCRGGAHSAWPGYMCCRACTRRVAATAHTDATELWAPGALRLPLSGSTTHAQSQR